MGVLSKAEEDVLLAILADYVRNDKKYFKTKYDIFPQYVLNNLRQYLESLKSKLLIASYHQMLDEVEIYLTPDGIDYFINNKKQIFPKNSRELLHQLLDHDISKNRKNYAGQRSFEKSYVVRNSKKEWRDM